MTLPVFQQTVNVPIPFSARLFVAIVGKVRFDTETVDLDQNIHACQVFLEITWPQRLSLLWNGYFTLGIKVIQDPFKSGLKLREFKVL